MPILKACSTATRDRVLCVEYCVSGHRRLPSIAARLPGPEVLLEPDFSGFNELPTSFAHCVTNGLFVDTAMKEAMPNHFVLKHLEGVARVGGVAHVDTFPINEVNATRAALPSFLGQHSSFRLEAMQVIVAISRRAGYGEGL